MTALLPKHGGSMILKKILQYFKKERKEYNDGKEFNGIQ